MTTVKTRAVKILRKQIENKADDIKNTTIKYYIRLCHYFIMKITEINILMVSVVFYQENLFENWSVKFNSVN